jgi:hypothetical protein
MRRDKPKNMPLTQVGTGQFRHVADGASIVVGSLAEPDASFIPQIYAGKWNNEAWLRLAVAGVVPEKAKPKFVKDKVGKDCVEHASKRGGKSELIRFRQGSTKIEIEWSRASDVPELLAFDLTLPPGVTAHKQPAPTPEQLRWSDDGAVGPRIVPDDVIDSHAIYYRKENNEYENGKLAHVYRAKLIAVNGDEIWLDANYINGQLVTQMPKAWLAGRTGGIVYDPTVGYTTQGASSGAVAYGYVIAFGGPYASAAGTLDSFAAYGSGTSATATFGVYTDSSGPSVLLATGTTSAISGTPSWQTGSINALYALRSGINIWIGMGLGIANFTINYDATAGNSWYYKARTYTANVLPDPYPSSPTQVSTDKRSVYLNYTAPATAVYRPRTRTVGV